MKYQQIIKIAFLALSVLGCKTPESQKTLYEPMTIGNFLDDWTCSVEPGNASNFNVAAFRLWVPNQSDVSKLKAIIVLSDHYNGSCLNQALSAEWQEYAKANNIGIIGVLLVSISDAENLSNTYIEAQGGSGQALIMALEAIAKRNNIPEVASLPFLMVGYSGGGMFSYTFSRFKPQRVVAFANIRGSILSQNLNENKNIPGLMLIAEHDEGRVFPSINIVLASRKQNGLWCYAIEPNVDHFGSITKPYELIKPFFSSALKLRDMEGSNELRSISDSTGWLGNNDSKAVFPNAVYPSNKNKASWLIDENFAREWRKFQLEQ